MTKKIDLWPMPFEVMLLIEYPGGPVYTNQVGGTSCMHLELEAVLAPLELGTANVQTILNLFDGFGARSIDENVATVIDAILASVPTAVGLKVDRTRLQECWEAWVYVTVDEVSDLPAWSGFGPGARGVLTWPNSD